MQGFEVLKLHSSLMLWQKANDHIFSIINEKNFFYKTQLSP